VRRALCALVVLGLLAAGCTRQQEEPAATPPPSPTEAPSPEPPPVAPLTGEELDEAIERVVLAVKIDNANAALPPKGIEHADVVIEEEVEGGITRLLALFHSQVPEETGPVRSGREVDVDLLPAFQAPIALSGAANVVDRMFERAGVRVMEDDNHMDAFYRADDRVAPHDLMLNPQPLWDVAAEEELPVLTEQAFAFDEETPDGGNDVSEAHLVFSPFANATWVWDGGEQRFKRQQNATDHATADGDTVSSDNVVIMRVEKTPGSRTDAAGTPTVELEVIGRGQMLLLRDGEVFRGRWRKPSREDQIEFLDREGDPLPLRPGQTWIELLPTDADLDITGRDSNDETESPLDS